MSPLASLPPGYFALVMATGMVSIASYFLGFHKLGFVLLWLNAAQYLALIGFTILRFARYRPQFVADLLSPSKGITFLTAAAGTFILGSQFVILLQMSDVGTALWISGIGLWILFVSVFFTTVLSSENKPTVAEGITGPMPCGATQPDPAPLTRISSPSGKTPTPTSLSSWPPSPNTQSCSNHRLRDWE